MTMTTNLTDQVAVETVRLVQCESCTPGGSHLARWARARRKGLITAEQAAAALDLLPVITNDAIVRARPGRWLRSVRYGRPLRRLRQRADARWVDARWAGALRAARALPVRLPAESTRRGE